MVLAPGAEENGLCAMLAQLVEQNLQAKPHKRADFDAMGRRGATVAIVAEDAQVALTLRFAPGKLTLHDGIVGIPDVAIRASSDMILAMSTGPLTTPLALPLPDPRKAEDRAHARRMSEAIRSGELKIYGALFHLPAMLHLSRIMSVAG